MVILGPTASRKSSLAVALAKKFSASPPRFAGRGRGGAEIVTADSMQIYKGMDIGTGKVSKTERRQVKHHLIDIVDPDHPFTLAQWQKRAFATIDTILESRRLPFLVGGTGLYISSIVDAYHIPHTEPNKRLRANLNKQGAPKLFGRLQKLDPKTARTIDRWNKRRLIRALEHVLTYDTSFADAKRRNMCPYDLLILGVSIPRQTLQKRINERVLSMYRRGLLLEVRQLVKKYHWTLPALQAIGYKEWRPYFAKKKTVDDVLKQIQKNTRNYAKRQMTWFRGMGKRHPIHWIENRTQAEQLIKRFL